MKRPQLFLALLISTLLWVEIAAAQWQRTAPKKPDSETEIVVEDPAAAAKTEARKKSQDRKKAEEKKRAEAERKAKADKAKAEKPKEPPIPVEAAKPIPKPVVFTQTGGMPEFSRIMNYTPDLVTTVYARDGRILGYLYREKRFILPLSEMPAHLVNAFLAAEDASFFEHEGIDLTAIFRAASRNVASGEHVQGGSTITQQVVKRLLLSPEKSLIRKAKEAMLAYRIERVMTKEQILAIYLNDIFFGQQAYGVEAAARTFFAKNAKDLSIAESAILAGLPKAPTKYNPFRDQKSAFERQAYVLERMRELGWITQEQFQAAKAEKLVFKSMPDPSWSVGAYYLEEVRRRLIDHFNRLYSGKKGDKSGEDYIYSAGLSVYTAIDLDHQAAAEKALKDGLLDAAKRYGWLGPITTLEPKDYKAFLDESKKTDAEIKPGKWFKALVTEVKREGAKVRYADKEGFIDLAGMKWARKPNPAVAGDAAPAVKDATGVLKPGDVVWASLREKSEKDKSAPSGLNLETIPKVQGALVSLEPPTGDVRALVGGYEFAESQFNRATQAQRQPGSSFKPIVYSAALDNGFTAASMIEDRPITYYDPSTKKTWEPKNYDGGYSGAMILRTALAKSKNLITIQVAEKIGVQKVCDRAKGLGLEGEFPPYLSVSLGAVPVTPLNLSTAYSAFARGGSWVEPRFITEIKDAVGKTIHKPAPAEHPGVSPENAFVMNMLLREVVEAGTGTRAKVLKRAVAGKTGTTNDEHDAWFIGYTPYLLTGIYVGFDQLTPMGKQETGGKTACPIFVKYRQVIENTYPPQDFPQPGNIVFESAGGFRLPFIAGTQPSVSRQLNLVSSPDADEEHGDSGHGSGQGHRQGSVGEENLLKQLF